MFHVEQKKLQRRFLEVFVEGAESLGFQFPEKTLEKFFLYYKELCQWGQIVNLTSLKDEKEKIVLLFLDSLAGSLALERESDRNLIDIGTGGGFPGLPVKIAFPSLRLTLVEARSKKTAFLINVIGKLELENVKVIQSRLDKFGCFSHSCSSDEKWDAAMVKGVNVAQVLGGMENLLPGSGKLVVFRSKNFDSPGIIRGMEIYKEIPYELPFGFGRRVLTIFKFSRT